ncbi:MAG: response regulator transcription factor [Eubacteriales bacterium]|nr:response regulator transcription factor [Eubacteriales bacterium]
MKKILIIEDDASIAEIERDFLEINGYEATAVADGVQGLQEASSGQYDLILLDLLLPNMDGLEICKRVRDVIDIPILMVTAKKDDVDKIRGLGLGANDYISKPFSLPELVARVKSHLAQYERLKSGNDNEGNIGSKSKELQIGQVKVNLLTRRVYVRKTEIELKNKEYELLVFLMSNPDIVFSKETLYDRIWGMEAYGDLKTIIVHINRLRDKIEKDPSNPVHIETVWGAGYRFKV